MSAIQNDEEWCKIVMIIRKNNNCVLDVVKIVFFIFLVMSTQNYYHRRFISPKQTSKMYKTFKSCPLMDLHGTQILFTYFCFFFFKLCPKAAFLFLVLIPLVQGNVQGHCVKDMAWTSCLGHLNSLNPIDCFIFSPNLDWQVMFFSFVVVISSEIVYWFGCFNHGPADLFYTDVLR